MTVRSISSRVSSYPLLARFIHVGLTRAAGATAAKRSIRTLRYAPVLAIVRIYYQARQSELLVLRLIFVHLALT